jgi:hypothetical protein
MTCKKCGQVLVAAAPGGNWRVPAGSLVCPRKVDPSTGKAIYVKHPPRW